jgi:tRNA(fMet)-specific endonuclease VapC
MKLSYLIDTDWIIHYLNGNKGIVEKIESLEKDGLAVSVISVAELYEGIYYSTNPASNEKALYDFLSGTSTLGIEDEVCHPSTTY